MRKSHFWAMEVTDGRVYRSEHYVLEAGDRYLELILPTRTSRRRVLIVLTLVSSVLTLPIVPLILQLGIPSNLTTVAAYLVILVVLSLIALGVERWSLRYLSRHPEESWRILVQAAQLGTLFHRVKTKLEGGDLLLRVQGLRGRISAALNAVGFSV